MKSYYITETVDPVLFRVKFSIIKKVELTEETIYTANSLEDCKTAYRLIVGEEPVVLHKKKEYYE